MALSNRQTQALWRQQDRLRRASLQKWSIAWQAYYVRQGEKLVNQLEDLNPYEGLFQKEDVERLFVRMYVDIGREFGVHGFEGVKHNVPKMQRKRIGYDEATIRTWENAMREYALVYGAESIVSISETGLELSQNVVQRMTAQAIEEGVSPDELARWIEAAIPKEWKLVGKFNAERIARTETMAAANYGSHVGAKSTGVAVAKTWLTAVDGRERDLHRQMNGNTIPIDEPFQVGRDAMQMPGAKGASAGNVINCRCAVAYRSNLGLS